MKNIFVYVLGFLCAAVLAAPGHHRRQDPADFGLVDGKPDFTFTYRTDSPSDTNWIGIYTPHTGPVGGKQDEPSLIWEYAPGSPGEVFLDAAALAPGRYEAWYLANDGYESIGQPFHIRVSLGFIPKTNVRLRNGRVGDAYEASIGGLAGDDSESDVTFSIEEDTWASISANGVISGTPGSAGDTELTITATTSDTSDSLSVTIPVQGAGARLVDDLSVMTYNLWHQGTQVNGYHAKQVAFLAEVDVDIVGLQESNSGRTNSLANALGWYHYHGSGSNGILSRYPIVEEYPDHGHGVAVRVDLGDSQVNVWDVHLYYTPYGPYDFCFDGMSVQEVLRREESSSRAPQIRETLRLMEGDIADADATPVLLLGDFNAPSHLDWTDATASLHCDVGAVDWPTSVEPIDAGLTDSLRVVDPNPLTDPHITWSPTFKRNGGRDEPMDRIDFIYHRGGLTPESGDTLVRGDPEPQPNHANNEWTSDHAAVLVRFSLD